MSTKKKPVDGRYKIPDYLLRPQKYDLGNLDVTALGKLKEEVADAINLNRKRYERYASCYTRLMIEARILFPEKHEAIRLLKKHAVMAPPDLAKLWEKFKVRWAAARQVESKRLHKNELERASRIRRNWKSKHPRDETTGRFARREAEETQAAEA